MINIKSIILAILFLYFISVIVVYFYQRKLLYYPLSPPTFTKDISGDGLIHKFETISFETSDNLNLKGWYHFKSLEKKTILFFHGNASNLDNRIYKLNLLGNLDVNFLIIAWRGYSGNPGKPSEAGLYQDSLGALKWLNKKGISNEKIILYGESLGTAVATEIGQNKKFAGIILESPFTSMIEMGKKYYPIFPVKLLIKDKYETKKKIKNIKFPILIMHGKKDKLVPFNMGNELYNLANEPKFKYFTEKDGHMMEFDVGLKDEINNFLESLE